MRLKASLLGLFCALPLTACTYLKYTAVQQEYARIQKASPAQKNFKHLIDQQTFYIVGQMEDVDCDCRNLPMAVAAFANDTPTYERVDTMSIANSGTHFGLNLPAGGYDLLVFADFNDNQLFDADEIIGGTPLRVDAQLAPENVVSNVVISLTETRQTRQVEPFAVRQLPDANQSLFYPSGTLRDLDDPLFDGGMATLGMYDPAAFLEQAPTMFYALEEEKAYKVPVIFVHGIGGSAREFSAIVAQLDRELYKPWFFYYPSGGDLEQLAELFYRIFLSGKVIPTEKMPIVIVAHSMGGLVVREALNRYNPAKDNNVRLFISIASPFDGHPAAGLGVKHGIMVLPAWRDLNPSSDFIQGLFRRPMPTSIEYQLMYTFGNSRTLKVGENSDGVVPLSSQLRHEAQDEAKAQYGFDAGHTEVLHNPELIEHLIDRISGIKTLFPENHMQAIFRGGFDLPLKNYSPATQYLIRNFGHYLVELDSGKLEPIDESQQDFLKLLKNKRSPKNRMEREVMQFKSEFPEYFSVHEN